MIYRFRSDLLSRFSESHRNRFPNNMISHFSPVKRCLRNKLMKKVSIPEPSRRRFYDYRKTECHEPRADVLTRRFAPTPMMVVAAMPPPKKGPTRPTSQPSIRSDKNRSQAASSSQSPALHSGLKFLGFTAFRFSPSISWNQSEIEPELVFPH